MIEYKVKSCSSMSLLLSSMTIGSHQKTLGLCRKFGGANIMLSAPYCSWFEEWDQIGCWAQVMASIYCPEVVGSCCTCKCHSWQEGWGNSYFLFTSYAIAYLLVMHLASLFIFTYNLPNEFIIKVDGEFWMGSQLFGSTLCTESRMGTLPLLGSDSVNPVWQGSNQELVVMVISIAFVFSLVNYVMDRWSMPVDLTLNRISTSADCLCMLLDGAGFFAANASAHASRRSSPRVHNRAVQEAVSTFKRKLICR